MSLRLRCREYERKGGWGKRCESVGSAFMRCQCCRRMCVMCGEISVKWNYKWKVNTVTDWWCFGLE